MRLSIAISILENNIPALLPPEVSIKWNAISDWVTPNGNPNLENVFSHVTNDMEVSVCNCSEIEFGSHKVGCLSVSDYIQYMHNHKKKLDNRILYLKDWHFVRDIKTYQPYEVPLVFTSDWMNEFWDFREDLSDDFRFVYFGPKNSWTPLHADVYRSYSWSANVCGTKKWFLIEPGEENKLIDKNGHLPSDLRVTDMDQIRYIEVVQEAGQVIFVPSGWFHQVMNLTDCISINHNWLNAFNVNQSWLHLQNQFQEVVESMADVKDTPDWEDACQFIIQRSDCSLGYIAIFQTCLRAYAGINYREFFIFLQYILLSRLVCYKNDVTINRSSPKFSSQSVARLLEQIVPLNERSTLENINVCLNSAIRDGHLDDCLSILIEEKCDDFWLEQRDCQSCCQVLSDALKFTEFIRILNNNDKETLKYLKFSF